MTHWVVLFIACVFLLFALPLAPALLEWRYRADDQPLNVVRGYDGNIRHFALRFGLFLEQHFPELMAGSLCNQATAQGVLPGGDVFQIVGTNGRPAFSKAEMAANACSGLVLGSSSLDLAEGMFFEKEIYAAGHVHSGDRNSFRAILARGNVELGRHCDVLRWAHSHAILSTGENARLYGRISADGEIRLHGLTRFSRMHAPVIRFGDASDAKGGERPPFLVGKALPAPKKVLHQTEERWLIAGSYDVPAGSQHRGSLVVKKNLFVGKNSHIAGDIKSSGELYLEGSLRIDGAVVASGDVRIGPGCNIKGPIVCEQSIVIETGSVIGTAECPTTITAAKIRVHGGVTAHGSVWARELGLLSSELEDAAEDAAT